MSVKRWIDKENDDGMGRNHEGRKVIIRKREVSHGRTVSQTPCEKQISRSGQLCQSQWEVRKDHWKDV